jgi:hypothetical protein
MRKRTIFRSSWIAVLGAVVLAAAAPVHAQETPPPAVHVVSEGETLWDLATRYFGDPFLWPEIYRLNTAVVEDPHWIFPGEELRLGGVPTAAGQQMVGPEPVPQPGVEPAPEPRPGEQQPEPVAQPAMPAPAAPPPPPSASGPTIFSREARGAMGVIGGAAYDERAARQYEFYSSGFLTEQQPLPWASVEGAIDRPTLARVPESSFAGMFENILIVPPAGATYQVGDSLLLAGLLRTVVGWGDIVYPTGIAEVQDIGPTGVVAEVVAQFNRITDGQVALPLEAFPDPGNVMPVPVENGMMGSIVEPRQLNPVPSMQQIVFIDLGRNAGVQVGDVFAILKPSEEEGMQPQTIGYVRIVHARDLSATGLIIAVMGLGIEAGSTVQLVQKMPS